eukprot:g2672.t1
MVTAEDGRLKISYVSIKKKGNTMSATKEEARKYIIEKDLQGISEKLMRGLLLTRPTDINACIVSILKGEDNGSAGSIDRAAADKYAEENNLKNMFKDLMADVVKAQEDDPAAYIIKKLSS